MTHSLVCVKHKRTQKKKQKNIELLFFYLLLGDS